MTVHSGDTRSRYSIDLVDLHTVCEGNYLRLQQVFPDYEHSNERRVLAGSGHLLLEVTERSRYTTMLTLTQISPLPSPQGGVRLEIRLYHDARMAEVVGFQAHRRVAGRYQYPNPNMYQRDEKHQQNRYLAELLAFCLAEGRIEMPGIPQGGV